MTDLLLGAILIVTSANFSLNYFNIVDPRGIKESTGSTFFISVFLGMIVAAGAILLAVVAPIIAITAWHHTLDMFAEINK